MGTSFYIFLRRIHAVISVPWWILKGKPVPPPHLIKQKILKEYANRFAIDVLIETGTYMGDMIFAMRDIFKEIYSIELDKNLYIRSKERFVDYPHIHIFRGDSSEVIPHILTSLTKPALFWLDAHYSGGITAKGKLKYPVIQELHHIFNHLIHNHVILIDDARLFIGQGDYPTIEELKKFVYKHWEDCVFEIRDDIIRIHQTEIVNRRVI